MRSSFQSERLLLIDGNAPRREAACNALSRAGYSVAVAGSRRDALWRLRAAPPFPAAVLLDYFMPEMNGCEFREHQRQTPAWLTIPVIVMPSPETTLAVARSIGAIGALRTPLDLDQLREVVGTLRSARSFLDAIPARFV
jgi:CheY-like chemotaxis protein